MSEAKNFRIGNLVDLGNRIGRISELLSNHCMVVDLEETQDTLEDFDRVQGIPLTEEWLVKFGFDKEEAVATGIAVWDEFYIGSFEISNSGTGFSDWSFLPYQGNVVKIKYVHQLQNLYFTLTGEELTLTQEING